MATFRRLRRRLSSEEGSLLIEVLVSAAILLTVSAGVVLALQTAQAQTALQRSKALATDVAQTKLDQLRSVAYNDLRPLNTTDTVTEGGMQFTVVSTAGAVSQSSAPTGCSSSRARDYMNLRTTVTWAEMGKRKPVVLQTMIAAPVGVGGGLVVSVQGAQGQDVAGIPLSLASGSVSAGNATTDASGCARWDAVSAGSGYALTGAVTGYVQPNGENAVNITGINIAAEETSEKSFAYDRGGAVRVRFRQKRSGTTDTIVNVDPGFIPQDLSLSATDTITRPLVAAGTAGDAGATGVAGLFYPYPSTAYSIYADSCPSAKPSGTLPTGAAPSTLITAGGTMPSATTATDLLLPNLNIKVASGSTSTTKVNVLTACGTLYKDLTINSSGYLVNPGLPYGTGFKVCVIDGTKKVSASSVSNTSYDRPGFTTATTLTLPSSGGTCPTGTT
jgi:Tfp pilus assembly protein PilV